MIIQGVLKKYWGESHSFVGNHIKQPEKSEKRDDRGF
jgi:hypothetical protein